LCEAFSGPFPIGLLQVKVKWRHLESPVRTQVWGQVQWSNNTACQAFPYFLCLCQFWEVLLSFVSFSANTTSSSSLFMVLLDSQLHDLCLSNISACWHCVCPTLNCAVREHLTGLQVTIKDRLLLLGKDLILTGSPIGYVVAHKLAGCFRVSHQSLSHSAMA
jgi:hypothetical protein